MASPITPNSLLVGGATGWHSGNQTLTYSFITRAPDYYAKVDTDGDGKADSYLITEGDEGEANFTIPFGADVAMGKIETALTRQALKEWAELANLNLAEVKPDSGKGADITLGSFKFDNTNTFGFVADFPDGSITNIGPAKLGTPSIQGDFWINTGNPDQLGAVYGNTGWQTYLHELGHAFGLHHPNDEGQPDAPVPFHNNQYTVMSYVAHPGMEGRAVAAQDWPITPMMYDIAAIQKLYGANLTTRTGATTYFGANGQYALKDGGLLANGRTAILTVWDAGGIDTLDASNQTGSVTIDLNPGAFSTIGKVANNIGLALAQTVGGVIVNLIENATGGSAADTLTGNVGNNALNGGAGADRMAGGAGNDTYIVDNARDAVIETASAGSDTVLSFVSYALSAGQQIEALQLLSATGQAKLDLTGNEFGQSLVGNNGSNVLNGGGGRDLLNGRGGDDTYIVDNAGDRVVEAVRGGNDKVLSFVSYTLSAGQEVEGLQLLSSTGKAALDLTGNAFGQTLIGNNGANVLDGGGGLDVLMGRGGADTFVFAHTLSRSNVEHIVDFAAEDTIRLSKTIFSALAPGELKGIEFKDIAKGKADADDHILYDSRNGDLFYDADGSGKAAAVKFAVLDNKTAITHADFLIA